MVEPRVVESELRARYAETDAQGVVYYANYLVWFEVARVNYLRAAGQDYRQWEARGFGIAIAQALCNYHAPARFNDPITLRVWVSEVGATSFRFQYQARHAETGALLADGHTVQVFIDLNDGRPIPIPSEARRVLDPEAPQPSGVCPS
ncbi:MAG: acyl-CoA thioesterase [Chloroflexi bacterium]|nr:acyl-CoA thioesterase [Chloroflexota bacterium]